jgi:hypothetical protein
MSSKSTAIFAVYPTYSAAEAALKTLRAKGFTDSDISIVAPHGVEKPPTPLEAHAVENPPTPLDPDAMSSEPVPASGPAASIGVALGWLTNFGAMAVSGAMVLAAGPIMATFKGVSDALLSIADALVGFGIPVEEAKKYEDRVRGGAILFSLHADEDEAIARGREIFAETGAQDISSIYKRKEAETPGFELAHAIGAPRTSQTVLL